MRTLFEIVEGAKDGQKPTHDECYYAMLALSALWNFASGDVRKLADEKTKPFARQMYATEHHRRNREALNTDPQKYMGNNVPGNPEYDRFRQVANAIAEKAIAKANGSGDRA